ncbi:type II toxin-antitoxin system VapC family toxin [Roseofilum sp. BLCC_M154]|uniref:Type II toxin-antitoxin system VapC family toxin n=1 Tax=Roseofilum acuticapitatum BLCC-M154 TaxID=3022444 RepID=A0ABT7AY15_9CYAN|nr:type II toxin-antitoxin system VapC family toxin [Roseofilum acuticapitatum]MDJ1171776.1 type II toxin-antitoxin system VapC family toxin [Roseofilum acuticapitatum BLCC-M154]
MTIKFLLDTNIISESIKLRPSEVFLTRFRQNIEDSAIASVTWHELLYGLYRLPESRRKRTLSDYLTQVIQDKMIILPYCHDAAQWFAQERARLTALGQMPSYPDGQIAAIARVNDLTLVTRNVSDYANFAGLTIENWFV